MKRIVREVSIRHGADLEIDLEAFSEREPIFAYVDDTGDGAKPLFGLDYEGRMVIRDQPDYLWLEGARDCTLFKVNEQGRRERRAVLRGLGIGEFCLEIYHVKPDQKIELIHKWNYTFK